MHNLREHQLLVVLIKDLLQADLAKDLLVADLAQGLPQVVLTKEIVDVQKSSVTPTRISRHQSVTTQLPIFDK